MATKQLKDVAALFPPDWPGTNIQVLIAGGAVVDWDSATDVDIFFWGLNGESNWEKWRRHLEVTYPTAVSYRANYPGEDGYFTPRGLIAGRYHIHLEDWDKPIDVIIYNPTLLIDAGPERVLRSFDIANIQIGYTLDGTCVTTDEFVPEGPIQLSRSGINRSVLEPGRLSKQRVRLTKYAERLGEKILRQSDANPKVYSGLSNLTYDLPYDLRRDFERIFRVEYKVEWR